MSKYTDDFNELVLQTAATDKWGVGYCAGGVSEILKRIKETTGANTHGGDRIWAHAYQYKEKLPQNGWVMLDGVSPEDAPVGAIIVFDRNNPPGTNGKGAQYGHVDFVTENTDGQRLYVSDKARTYWGGSVPKNFVGVYVHPDLAKLDKDSKIPANYREVFGLDNEAFTDSASYSDQFNIESLLGGENPIMAILNALVMMIMGVDVNNPETKPQPEPVLTAENKPNF